MPPSESIVQVSVAKLRELCDPLTTPLWQGLDWPVRTKEVQQAVAEGRLNPEVKRQDELLWDRQQHVERIAWFVARGIDRPIEIDVGAPSQGCHVDWVIQDGNHRFAAAIIRGDQAIPASAAGEIDEIKALVFE